MPPGTISPVAPIATCPDTNTNGPALTAGENGSGCPPAPVRVSPRNSTLIGSSDCWTLVAQCFAADRLDATYMKLNYSLTDSSAASQRVIRADEPMIFPMAQSAVCR